MTNQRSSKPGQGLTGEWGILGGTFDPIQLGHLTLARELQIAKKLTGVLFVPAYKPTHKMSSCVAGWKDRLAMVRLATAENHEFLVSTIEADMDLTGYSLDTVRAIKERSLRANFYFIVGEDLLRELATWHQPKELLKEICFIVGSRRMPTTDASHASSGTERIEHFETSMIDISSTLVRKRIREGISREELDRLVGERVAEYIIERKLYQ